MKNILFVFMSLSLLAACSTGPSPKEKIAAMEAEIDEIMRTGRVVSETKGMTFTPGVSASVEEIRKKVNEECLAEGHERNICDNLETIDHGNGTMTIQYRIK